MWYWNNCKVNFVPDWDCYLNSHVRMFHFLLSRLLRNYKVVKLRRKWRTFTAAQCASRNFHANMGWKAIWRHTQIPPWGKKWQWRINLWQQMGISCRGLLQFNEHSAEWTAVATKFFFVLLWDLVSIVPTFSWYSTGLLW